MQAVADNSIFRLIVNPTLNCNFRCWYCYETHKAESNMSDQTVSHIKKTIKRLMIQYDKFELSFFGGEPLLKYHDVVLPLMKFVDSISKETGCDYTVSFTTNGFLISNQIIYELKQYKTGVFQITLDGGPESHNKTRESKFSNSFETIVTNINKLANEGISVVVRINVTKDNITGANVIPAMFEDLSENAKKNIYILIQQVWQDVKNDILDEILELYEEFIKIGIKPWYRRFNYTKDICYGDSAHSCVINYDGKIFKCTAMDFEHTSHLAELREDGLIDFKESFFEKLKIKQRNPNCTNCRIRPLCNGGCFKNVLQSKGSPYCMYKTEEQKDQLIRDTVKEQLFMMRHGLGWKTLNINEYK